MNIIKTIGRCVGVLMALPYLVGYMLLRPVLGAEHAYGVVSESVSKVSGVFGVYTRQVFYRYFLARVGSDVYFGFMSLFSKRWAAVGDGVYIGRFCVIGYAELGDQVMLADGVQVLSGRHQHGSSSEDGGSLRDNPQQFEKVTIGKGAWVGAGAVVMADVGERAVVGAGAVVVKPVAAGDKVGGVPAKPLKG